MIGRILAGQYRVLDKIGEGGMGEVYVVEHTLLKKQFAAKVLIGDAAGSADSIARFEREAIAASRLDHDNIIDVVNFGRSEDGTVFLIMELLRGETLDRVIARGPMAIEDAVRAAAQIGRALEAAHGAGIVHRDLKPENVFVARRRGGRPVLKLLDFGISTIKDWHLTQARLTQSGDVLGSPLYMSPEACRGALDLDARADLYALGVMLFEMVTGTVPFTAPNLLVILQLHLLEAPPRPRELRPELPAAVERVILRALAKDRDDRYGSVGELLDELLAAVPVDADLALGFAEASGEIVLPPRARVTSDHRRRRTPGRPRTNLTAAANRFVGRPREVDEAAALVRATRLVTLTGAGGAGKTRLAIEVADRFVGELEHGAWIVELAALRDPALVEATVAQALGYPPGVSLAAALAGRRMLVVLDNCEHLIAACATLAERLLRDHPALSILATSREPLAIAGETLYRVPPLSGDDAVALFVERARAAAPGFDAADTATIAEICARLDGIPLALELAAARVRTLSVAELRARLGDRFKLLTGGSRTALPRQQTLRALIDWSHELLDEPSRVLLRRLAVFAGGFSLAQAEAITGVDDVLDLLCGLVDRSLVVAEPRGATTRYRLLETIREYAAEKLTAGEAAGLRARHRAELLRWADALLERYGDSTEDVVWLDALTADHDNLRAAMEVGGDDDDRFAAVLRRFWLVRGHVAEARAFVTALLARPWPEARRLALLEAAVTFATALREYDAAAALIRESLPLATRLGEGVRAAQAQTQLAFVHYLQCHFHDADREAIEALAAARASGAPFPLRFALNIAGMVASRVGDHARAVAVLEEVHAITADTGGRQYHGNVLESLGTAFALRDGSYELAVPLYRASASVFLAVGDPAGQLSLCERFAQVAAVRGEHAQATRLLAAAAQARERLAMPLEPVDELDLNPVRALLDAAMPPETARAARAEGRALGLAQALTLAIDVT